MTTSYDSSLSQPAVATFVFGALQITISAVILGFMWYTSQLANAIATVFPTEAEANPDPSMGLGFIAIIHFWGILSLITGGFAIISIGQKGHTGVALTVVGMLFSLISIVAFFVVPALFF